MGVESVDTLVGEVALQAYIGMANVNWFASRLSSFQKINCSPSVLHNSSFEESFVL